MSRRKLLSHLQTEKEEEKKSKLVSETDEEGSENLQSVIKAM